MFDDPIKECPKCGEKVRRLITGGSGIIFKGSGFYVTDNKRSSAASAAPRKKSESKDGDGSGAKSADAKGSGKEAVSAGDD